MIKADEKQQNLLEAFFKEETTWQAEHVGYALMSWLFIGISLIFFLIPFQEWPLREDLGIRIVMYGLELTGILYSVQKYNAFAETGKVRLVYDILRYKPVDYGQLCIFKMRKVRKLCLGLTIFILFWQMLFALAFFHSLILESILVPIVTQLVLPMVFTGITMIRVKRY